MPSIIRTAIVAAAATLAAPAFAQGYFGVSAGATNANIDCAGTLTCDNNDNGGKVFGGYRFPFGLGVEGMAYTYGEAKATLPYLASFATSSVKGRGFGAGVSYLVPFSPAWSATFRLGLASNRTTATATIPGLSGTVEESNPAAYSGLQFSFHPSRNLSIDVGADFTRFELDGDKYSARMLGVGLTFSF
jgi:hypothetical protein